MNQELNVPTRTSLPNLNTPTPTKKNGILILIGVIIFLGAGLFIFLYLFLALFGAGMADNGTKAFGEIWSQFRVLIYALAGLGIAGLYLIVRGTSNVIISPSQEKHSLLKIFAKVILSFIFIIPTWVIENHYPIPSGDIGGFFLILILPINWIAYYMALDANISLKKRVLWIIIIFLITWPLLILASYKF
ncbi:MAG: hypothetical protein AAB948_02000 [Patescibacteria group bacterium]